MDKQTKNLVVGVGIAGAIAGGYLLYTQNKEKVDEAVSGGGFPNIDLSGLFSGFQLPNVKIPSIDFSGLKESISDASNSVKSDIGNNSVKSDIGNLFDPLGTKSFFSGFNETTENIKTGLGSVPEWLNGIADGIKNIFKAPFSGLYEGGFQAGEGLGTFTNVVMGSYNNAIIDAGKGFRDIASYTSHSASNVAKTIVAPFQPSTVSVSGHAPVSTAYAIAQLKNQFNPNAVAKKVFGG